MDNEPFNRLVSTFFTCRRDDLIEIFTELLDAIEAESHLQPGGVMSRNYETAQANPEIHTIPGNLKDARDAIFPFFWGTDGWASDLHIENVKGRPATHRWSEPSLVYSRIPTCASTPIANVRTNSK